jgi:DNA-binding XRE family transcriptional regulator
MGTIWDSIYPLHLYITCRIIRRHDNTIICVREIAMATFAERLRELRQKAGLTQQQLADATELTLGAITNYEQGRRTEPSLQIAQRLAEALGKDCRAFADCVAGESAPRPRGRPARVGDDRGKRKGPQPR